MPTFDVSLFLFILAVLIVAGFLLFAFGKRTALAVPGRETQKKILEQHVLFYQQLPEDQKHRFEERVDQFLHTTRITGVRVEAEELDMVLVAAAAIIPIFAFDKWDYRNIHEVLLYPGSFSQDFQIEGQGRNTLGMVGNGPMQHVMILSKPDLRHGFMNQTSTSNPAIHEFVHLIDKSDGSTDGLPEVLLQHQASLPWIHLMHKEIQKIQSGRSDINPYGSKNEAEFLAVAAEYFFKQPARMQEKHPELFKSLNEIFRHIE